MQIFVNGDPVDVEDGISVATFVSGLSDDPRGIAIERNREIVPKSEHGNVMLEAGDRLEVVQFVGGG